jgi:hypothetical protein
MLAKNTTVDSSTTATNNPNVATANIYNFGPSTREERLVMVIGLAGWLKLSNSKMEMLRILMEMIIVRMILSVCKDCSHEDMLNTPSEADLWWIITRAVVTFSRVWSQLDQVIEYNNRLLIETTL